MKKTVSIPSAALLIGVMLFCFCTAKAADMSFQPRLEAGVMDYSFESEAVSITELSLPDAFNSGQNKTQQAFEYSDNLPFVGGGGTFFMNRFFLDLSVQYAFDGDDSTKIAWSGYAPYEVDHENFYVNSSFVAAEPLYKTSFDRRDMAVSLGYAFSRQFSLFVGYKVAETEFKSTYEGPFSNVGYRVDSALDGFSAGRVWGENQFTFEYEGPFIGAIHGWDFSHGRFFKGMLTASLALAYLEGEVVLNHQIDYLQVTWMLDQQVSGEPRVVEGGSVTNRFDTRGDTLGLTVGMGWRGSTAVKGLSYYLGISGYRYEFDAEDNDQSDINETALVFKGGLSYAF